MTERVRIPSARTRILGWYVLLLAVALAVGLLLQRAFLLGEVSDSVNDALDQEAGEFAQLVEVGIDPETGEPFAGDLAAVFTTFLQRNVALEGEAIVTILDGRPYRGDAGGQAYRESELIEVWSAVTESTRATVDTDLGQVRYLAVPITTDEGQAGVFVAAMNMSTRLQSVNDLIRVGALVYGSIFLFASVAAWLVAGGVLKPLRLLGDTARSITETDLSRRIPVEGDDEIAELARTFNDMLERLEEGFANQRRFVDDAGHELRTPITVIRGNLELMSDDPEERAETVALVTAELDSMSRIVDDLLALAKAEQPDFIDAHPVDLVEFVEDIERRAAALPTGAMVVESVEPTVVEVDGQRVGQAVLNLIRNAFEHTPADTKVTLGARVQDGWLHVTVSDDGPGIPEAEQQFIFERFARGQTGKRTTSGAGLGLPIVAAIAEGHGGRIDVESGLGLGTTFTLVIPAEAPP